MIGRTLGRMIGWVIGPPAVGPAVALGAIVVAATACSHTAAQATVASALEAVPLRLAGSQTIDVQLAGRQPATACDRLPAGEAVRIHDGPLVISVPPGPPAVPGGTTRIVPKTSASYVVAPDGTATAWRDRTLAVGDEGDVASFVGVDLQRTSPVGAVRAVTWVTEALDDAGAYAAIIRGPDGPPDVAGATWTAAGATHDGGVVTVRATAAGLEARRTVADPDPCAYRRAPS